MSALFEQRPLLVGEDNPYGSDPRYALYPEPANSAGGRLCRLVMGLSVKDYVRGFDRANLCSRKWTLAEARETSRRIRDERGAEVGSAVTVGASRPYRLDRAGFCRARTVVLLGSKVAEAFGCSSGRFEPFKVSRASGSLTYATLPHPSGRCRAWCEPGAFDRARAVLREAGVLPLPRLRCEYCGLLGEVCVCPVDEDGDLLRTEQTTRRPAKCSNCGVVVRGDECPDCGAP